jgi:hypothetical protein
VRGDAEGTPGWFLVDSGASYGATRKGPFAALNAAHPRPVMSGFYTPALVGTFWAEAATIGWLEVSGLRVDHVFTRTIDDDVLAPPTPIGSDTFLGVLPSGYLHHFMVTVDFEKKKLRLDATKDDMLREPTQLYVLGISLEQTPTTPVHVASVLPGSPAAADGIVVGDEIVGVEGMSFASIQPFLWPFKLASATEGAMIHVDVKHGDTTTTHTIVTRDLLTSPDVH